MLLKKLPDTGCVFYFKESPHGVVYCYSTINPFYDLPVTYERCYKNSCIRVCNSILEPLKQFNIFNLINSNKDAVEEGLGILDMMALAYSRPYLITPSQLIFPQLLFPVMPDYKLAVKRLRKKLKSLITIKFLSMYNFCIYDTLLGSVIMQNNKKKRSFTLFTDEYDGSVIKSLIFRQSYYREDEEEYLPTCIEQTDNYVFIKTHTPHSPVSSTFKIFRKNVETNMLDFVAEYRKDNITQTPVVVHLITTPMYDDECWVLSCYGLPSVCTTIAKISAPTIKMDDKKGSSQDLQKKLFEREIVCPLHEPTKSILPCSVSFAISACGRYLTYVCAVSKSVVILDIETLKFYSGFDLSTIFSNTNSVNENIMLHYSLNGLLLYIIAQSEIVILDTDFKY